MRLFPILITLLISPIVRADFISWIKADQCETIVEYFVDAEGIRVTLEIGPKDFGAFREMVPSELGGSLQVDQIDQQLKKFTRDVFRLYGNGNLLSAELQILEVRDRIRRASLYSGKVDSSVVLSQKIWYIELFYPASGLSEVQISPPREGEKLRPCNIGFVLYHKGIPVNDLRYLSGDFKVTLDPEDPWYSQFDNPGLRRHHKSSLMSFLYVDPYEVRHEILIRVKDLEEWMDLEYSLDDRLDIDDQELLKERVGQFILDRNPLIMDGDRPMPRLKQVQFLEVSLAGTQIVPPGREISYASAIVGVILAYPNQGIPNEVIIEWDMFSDRIDQVPYVASDPVGPLPGYLDLEHPNIEWKNYLKTYTLPGIARIETERLQFPLLPLFLFLLALSIIMLAMDKAKRLSGGIIGLCLVFSGLLYFEKIPRKVNTPFVQTSYPVEEAKALQESLLNNVYRSFDYSAESDIYDKLALSIEGPLLSEVYIQMRRSHVLENQGGLEVRMKDVQVDTLSEIDPGIHKKAYEVEWTAKGEIGHWGHMHRRNNRYRAQIFLNIREGSWKITELELLEEERLL
jgi:hypothetical protein